MHTLLDNKMHMHVYADISANLYEREMLYEQEFFQHCHTRTIRQK